MSTIAALPEIIIGGALTLTIGFEMNLPSSQVDVFMKATEGIHEFKCRINNAEYKNLTGCDMPENIIAAGKLHELIPTCQYKIEDNSLYIINEAAATSSNGGERALIIPEIIDVSALQRQISALNDEVVKLRDEIQNAALPKSLGRIENGCTTPGNLFGSPIKFIANHHYTTFEFRVVWKKNKRTFCRDRLINNKLCALIWAEDTPEHKRLVEGMDANYSPKFEIGEQIEGESIRYLNIRTVASKEYCMSIHSVGLKCSNNGEYVYNEGYYDKFEGREYHIIELYQRI